MKEKKAEERARPDRKKRRNRKGSETPKKAERKPKDRTRSTGKTMSADSNSWVFDGRKTYYTYYGGKYRSNCIELENVRIMKEMRNSVNRKL